MADSKISALPASTTPLAGTEVLPIVQSSATKQVTVANLTAGRSVSAASLALTTSPLPATSGGTGSNSAFTANGVAYASSTTVVTTGSALTFDGTKLGIGTTSPSQKLEVNVNGGNSATAYALIAAGGINKANQKFGVAFDDPTVMSIYGTYDGSAVRRTQLNYAAGTHAFGSSAMASTFSTIDSSGNVGIGTTANASAILDAQSTTKGVRMPNMTTTQKNAIASPAAGLMVFDTTLAKLCVYSGAAWQTITSI